MLSYLEAQRASLVVLDHGLDALAVRRSAAPVGAVEGVLKHLDIVPEGLRYFDACIGLGDGHGGLLRRVVAVVGLWRGVALGTEGCP